MHYINIRVEGFEIHNLLSQCLKEGIRLSNVKILSDYEFTAEMDGGDWARLLRLAGSRYHASIEKEKGTKPFFLRLLSRRSTIAGLVIFLIIIFLQTSFISEIRIYGYERLTEREILESLREAGLFVGCSRSVDPEDVKIQMYRSLDNLSWIGITYKGGLAEVTIAEGTDPASREEDVEKDRPCHIVAVKEGYIEKIIAREGGEAVVKDDFVHVGDVLISGILQIDDKTYSQDPDNVAYRYVHADGEVYAKTIYRFICYQEVYDLEKRTTGKGIPGVRLTLGTREFNTANLITPYKSSVYNEKRVFGFLWPFPLELAVNHVSELELYRTERTQEDIEKQGNGQVRELIKNHIPESAQILNKSLNFSPEENIIKVTVMIEALEQIGQKKAFAPPRMEVEPQPAE